MRFDWEVSTLEDPLGCREISSSIQECHHRLSHLFALRVITITVYLSRNSQEH